MSLRLFSLLYRKGQDSKLSKYFIGNRSENCDQHPLLGGWDGRGTRRNRYDPPLPNSRLMEITNLLKGGSIFLLAQGFPLHLVTFQAPDLPSLA